MEDLAPGLSLEIVLLLKPWNDVILVSIRPLFLLKQLVGLDVLLQEPVVFRLTLVRPRQICDVIDGLEVSLKFRLLPYIPSRRVSTLGPRQMEQPLPIRLLLPRLNHLGVFEYLLDVWLLKVVALKQDQLAHQVRVVPGEVGEALVDVHAVGTADLPVDLDHLFLVLASFCFSEHLLQHLLVEQQVNSA